MPPSRGVMGCLAAGFEIVGQNPFLIALPVALDLFLWLGPRISVGPLVDTVVDFLTVQMPNQGETASRVTQATQLLREFGAEFNLVSVAGGVPLLQVPSLFVRRVSGPSPLGAPRVFPLSNPLAVVPWWAVFALMGLGLGFLYLNEIAHRVEGSAVVVKGGVLETSQDGAGVGDEADPGGGRKLLRFLLFAVGLLVIGLTVVPLWLFVVALGTMIAQPLGILLWMGGAGFLGYAGVHLVFVVPSILLGERSLPQAIGESIVLSHLNLWSLFGLIALALVIYEGLGYAWSLPADDSWILTVGVLGNAFVATGLTSAAFVFYCERRSAVRRLARPEG